MFRSYNWLLLFFFNYFYILFSIFYFLSSTCLWFFGLLQVSTAVVFMLSFIYFLFAFTFLWAARGWIRSLWVGGYACIKRHLMRLSCCPSRVFLEGLAFCRAVLVSGHVARLVRAAVTSVPVAVRSVVFNNNVLLYVLFFYCCSFYLMLFNMYVLARTHLCSYPVGFSCCSLSYCSLLLMIVFFACGLIRILWGRSMACMELHELFYELFSGLLLLFLF